MIELLDCMQMAIKQAKGVFSDYGYHENIIMGFTQGSCDVIGLHYQDDIEKRAEILYIQTIFARKGVEAYVHIAEAWTLSVKPGEALISARTSPKRQEAIIVFGVSRTEKLVCMMNIKRSGDKAWLEDGEISDASKAEGAFSDLLLDKKINSN